MHLGRVSIGDGFESRVSGLGHSVGVEGRPHEAGDVGGRGNGRPPRLQRRDLLERMRRM